MINIRKFKAFTLAEVLITLGIIGVVAAMTIPTLITNTQGQQYRSRYKKAVSTLSQAALMNKANYGWDYAGVSEPCTYPFDSETSADHMSICAIFNTNFSSKIVYYVNAELSLKMGYKFNGNFIGVSDGAGQYTVFQMADGTYVGVRSGSTNKPCILPVGKTLNEAIKDRSITHCSGFIDINGVTLPNREVQCSEGVTSKDLDEPCIVKNKDITDVYPVIFHDSTVEGYTNAAQYVLHSTK